MRQSHDGAGWAAPLGPLAGLQTTTLESRSISIASLPSKSLTQGWGMNSKTRDPQLFTTSYHHLLSTKCSRCSPSAWLHLCL